MDTNVYSQVWVEFPNIRFQFSPIETCRRTYRCEETGAYSKCFMWTRQKRNSEGKRQLWRTRHRWEDNNKIDIEKNRLKEPGLDATGSRYDAVTEDCDHGNEPSSSSKTLSGGAAPRTRPDASIALTIGKDPSVPIGRYILLKFKLFKKPCEPNN